MLSHVFLGMSLLGAEWVLYFLVSLSVLSVTLIFERALFYRAATRELMGFREKVRQAATQGKWDEALGAAQARAKSAPSGNPDLESKMALSLITHAQAGGKKSPEILQELARSAMIEAKMPWDRNLSILATIGANAPFVGLFGTVLGIIKAFHDLSQQSSGAQTVTAGISEALVATAVGLLVAIPAVVAYNVFQRKVKAAMSQAESFKSFLIGKLSG